MTTFDNREFGYEAKFAHDQEVIFKATARRNKLIAHWAADKLGFVEEEAAKYADLMIRNSLKVSDDDDVVHRILEDFRNHGMPSSEHRIRQKLSHFMSIALGEVTATA
nr:DUF1476 domain-containing protein [uncultured Cohaesibacter sp.]